MKSNRKIKLPLSELIFYICSFIMIFSVFMFFMSPLKWVDSSRADYSIPSFFNLIFGGNGGFPFSSWPVISGIVFMFIFQIILIGTLLTTSVLLILKKIKGHTAVCILIGIAVLALVCGILALCTNIMISRKYIYPDIPGWEYTYKDLMKLNYGAYLYGITMILASCGSIAAFVLDHYKK